MEQLAARYRGLVEEYEETLNRCADQGRDPDPTETAVLNGLRSEMDPLGERLVELRDTEERKWAAVEAMNRAPMGSAGAGTSLVQVRSEPELYRRDNQIEISFFRDLLHAGDDPDCRSRIERHNLQMRAMGTTGTGPGSVPPTWLFEEFAILQHGARPWADTLRKVGITDANPVNIGKQVTPGATVAAQVNEGDPATDGSWNSNLITTQPKTYTGKVDVSRQLVDGSNPAIDSLVYADAMGAYNEQIEQAVVNAFEAATGLAATITYPGVAPAKVYTNLPDAFIDAAASVNKHRKQPATVVLMSIGAWAFLVQQKDQAGRPLVTTGSAGNPMNAYGQAGAAQVITGVAGEVVGLAVVPSWAGVDNHIYVLKADDCLLLESSVFNFRYEEVLGPSAIRLGVWGYAAPVIGRYPVGIAQINAGTTIPAPAEMDAAKTPAAVGPGTGEGPGTPPRRR
jgi:HK97 family phage major capsid protein